MTCSIVKNHTCLQLRSDCHQKKLKKSHFNYGLVVFLIDVLVIVVLVVIILVVSVVVHVVITVGNLNRNSNLLQCLLLEEFVALEIFGYTSSVIAHLLASLPFHSWKIFASYSLYTRFIAVIFKKEKKRKNLECEANWVEVDKGFMYGFVFTFLLGSYHFQSSFYYYAN